MFGSVTMRVQVAGALLLAAAAGRAANHDLHIQELMAGANGDSRVQFIVVELDAPGENLWGPQPGEPHSRAMLLFFDATGRQTGEFRFPSSPPARDRVLLGTAEFARLPGAPRPDIVIPPLVHAIAGQVCFRNNPANPAATPKNECVAYGPFAGDPEINWSGDPDVGVAAGPPAPRLPITGTRSLLRTLNTGQNADFVEATTPTPVNAAGATFTMPVAGAVAQGETLFEHETFDGNGRTCATCHAAEDGFALTPSRVQSRFERLGAPFWSYDPLFIGESAPSGFDAGFDFNLNTLELAAQVMTPAPCTGELRGSITSANGARAKVLARTGPASYLIYGGSSPPLTGTVGDGVCSGFVAQIRAGDLAGRIDDPVRMRDRSDPDFPEGRALISENIDGFENPPVFRRSPHLLNLRYTAPYGLSGEFGDLQTFTSAAVRQHFPRTLARESRGADPDFRPPTPEELAAIEAFLIAQEFPAGDDPNKFDPAQFATTESQRRGRGDFGVFGCALCHGGPVLAETTQSIGGKRVGVNVAFDTGTADARLPCEPASRNIGPCGSREFSTPQLFNLSHLGPFFHNGTARTLADAVNFYRSAAFGGSPSNFSLIAQGLATVPTDAIIAFLEGLVVRPYTLGDAPVRFGPWPPRAGATPTRTVTITNLGSSALDFDPNPCRLEGSDPDAFAIAACPLATPLAPSESRTIRLTFDPDSDGARSAILEVHPLDEAPSGVDLFGVGGSPGPPPAVSESGPVEGPVDGGHEITLRGANFVDGITVTLGGVPAGFVAVVTPTTIQARTGRHGAGSVDITVVNPDGQTAVLADGYTYVSGGED